MSYHWFAEKVDRLTTGLKVCAVILYINVQTELCL